MKDKHDRSLKKMKSFDSVSTCNNNVRNHMKSYDLVTTIIRLSFLKL